MDVVFAQMPAAQEKARMKKPAAIVCTCCCYVRQGPEARLGYERDPNSEFVAYQYGLCDGLPVCASEIPQGPFASPATSTSTSVCGRRRGRGRRGRGPHHLHPSCDLKKPQAL